MTEKSKQCDDLTCRKPIRPDERCLEFKGHNFCTWECLQRYTMQDYRLNVVVGSFALHKEYNRKKWK